MKNRKVILTMFLNKYKNKINELETENKKLSDEIKCKQEVIDNLQKFSSSFREFYDNVNQVKSIDSTRDIVTLKQSQYISPVQNVPVDILKARIARDFAGAITNYVTFDLEDDPTGNGNKLLVGTIGIVNKL